MRISFPVHQLINSNTLANFKKALLKTVSESSSQIKTTNQLKTLKEKFNDANKWYIKLTRLDQVYLAQERVSDLQGKLLEIQEKRREVSKQLNDVRALSIELQDKIHKVKRQEDLEKFLDLMKEETEILKLEKAISKTFQQYDQTERELFTAFTNSIRDSHEKQRAQMEYTKYFGLILSIVSSFLAFIYSTLHKEQLIKVIDGKLMSLNALEDRPENSNLDKLIRINDKLVKQVKNNIKSVNRLIQSGNSNNNNTKNGKLETEESRTRKFIKYFGVVVGVWCLFKILSS